MIQEWSKLGKEMAWIACAFCLSLAPSKMGYAPVTMGCCCVLFVYVLARLWKEK